MPQSATVKVETASAVYQVVIGSGVLPRLAELLGDLPRPSAVGIISDETVWALYGEQILAQFQRLSDQVVLYLLPPGERYKTLESYGAALETLISGGLARDSLVVNVGGGVVGDLGGFTAATLLRGVPFVQVPTTLLAQVDASVGGKVAIDHAGGKNTVGVFTQPAKVIAPLETLQTLPLRQRSNGLAEVVKYAMLGDRELFALLENHAEAALAADGDVMQTLVTRSIKLKAQLVAQDERDVGVRQLLNFGHTVGHALEAATGYQRLLHGEAVAIGMAIATHYAVQAGLCQETLLERLVRLLKALHLPYTFSGVAENEILAKMNLDKKRLGRRLRLVLPTGEGRCELVDEVDITLLEASIRTHKQG